MALPNPALSQVPDSYKYGWHDVEQPRTTFPKGITAEIVAEISRIKGEPEWMTKLRLKAFRHFKAFPMPKWGADLDGIDFQDIYYYVTGTDKAAQSWDDVPDYIRRTYDKLGIPEAEEITSPASVASTTPKSSITTSARTSRSRASCSSAPMRP